MGAPNTHSSTERIIQPSEQAVKPDNKVVLIRLLTNLQDAIESLLDELIKEVK